ncbi:hypothetical protein pb186bvf_011459 [Paramecium bursaria]
MKKQQIQLVRYFSWQYFLNKDFIIFFFFLNFKNKMYNPGEFLKFINKGRTLPLHLDHSLDDYFIKAQQHNQNLQTLFIDTNEIIRIIENQGKQIQFTFEAIHIDQIGQQFINQDGTIYSGILEILKQKEICFDNTYTSCFICPLKSRVQYAVMIILQRQYLVIDSIIQQQNFLQIQGWINNKSFCQGQLLKGDHYCEFNEEDCRFKAIPNLDLKLFEIRLQNKNSKILPLNECQTEKIYEQDVRIQKSNLNHLVEDQKYIIQQFESLFRSCLEDNQPRNSLQRKIFNEDNDVFDKFTQNLQQKYLKDPRPISNIDGLISNKSNLMDSTLNPIESIYFVDDSNCSFLKQTIDNKPSCLREMQIDKPKTPNRWNQQSNNGTQELVKSKVQFQESFGLQLSSQRVKFEESKNKYQGKQSVQQTPYFQRQDIQDSITKQQSRFQQETPNFQQYPQQYNNYSQLQNQQEQIQQAYQQAIYQTPVQYQQQINPFSQPQPQLNQLGNQNMGNMYLNAESDYFYQQYLQNQQMTPAQYIQNQQQYELQQNQILQAQLYNQQLNNYQQSLPQLQDFTQLIQNQQNQIVQLQQYVQQQESVLYPNLQQVQQLQQQIITLQQQLIQMQHQQTQNNQSVIQTPSNKNHIQGKENIQSNLLEQVQGPVINTSQLNSIRLSWNEDSHKQSKQKCKHFMIIPQASQIKNNSKQKIYNTYYQFNAVYQYVHQKIKDQELKEYLFSKYKFIRDQHFMNQNDSLLKDLGPCDFNLQINGKNYQCHKRVLKCQSQLLAQYIDEGKSQLEFTTPLDHPNSINYALKYIYTGCYLSDAVGLNYQETKSIYLIAQKLKLNNLIDAAIFHGILKYITYKNVIKWFKVAQQNKKSHSDIYLFLKEYCIDYFSLNIQQILQNWNNLKLQKLLYSIQLDDFSSLLSKAILSSQNQQLDQLFELFLKITNKTIIECVASISKKYDHYQGFTFTKIEQNYNVSDQLAVYECNLEGLIINLLNKNYDYNFNDTNLVYEVLIEEVNFGKVIVCPQFYSTSQKWQMLIEISEGSQISIYFQQVGLIDELQKKQDYQQNSKSAKIFTSCIIKIEMYSNSDLINKQSFFHSFPNGQKHHIGISEICKVYQRDIKIRVFIEENPLFGSLLECITKQFDPSYAKQLPTFVLFSILSSDHLYLNEEEDLYRVFQHKELTLSNNEILIYSLRSHELKSLNTFKQQLDQNQLDVIFSQLTKYDYQFKSQILGFYQIIQKINIDMNKSKNFSYIKQKNNQNLSDSNIFQASYSSQIYHQIFQKKKWKQRRIQYVEDMKQFVHLVTVIMLIKLGKDLNDQRLVALKIFKNTHALAQNIKALMTEIQIMKELNHPNLVNLIEFNEAMIYQKRNGVKSNRVVIVVELASGGELFEYVAQTGKFSEEISRYYFRQLIEGLSYIHSRGIAHRDLKPENLLFDQNFQLRIADFGFAASVNKYVDHKFKSVLGTPGYMAPEINAKVAYDGEKTDLFAAAVILFIMFAGSPPFSQAQPNDAYYKMQIQGKNDLFWNYHAKHKGNANFFSQDFKELVSGLIHPNPEQRWNLAKIKASNWFNGPVASPDVVLQEFNQRKAIIDKEIQKEIMKKRAQKNQKPQTGVHAGIGKFKGDGDEIVVDAKVREIKIKRINPEYQLRNTIVTNVDEGVLLGFLLENKGEIGQQIIIDEDKYLITVVIENEGVAQTYNIEFFKTQEDQLVVLQFSVPQLAEDADDANAFIDDFQLKSNIVKVKKLIQAKFEA